MTTDLVEQWTGILKEATSIPFLSNPLSEVQCQKSWLTEAHGISSMANNGVDWISPELSLLQLSVARGRVWQGWVVERTTETGDIRCSHLPVTELSEWGGGTLYACVPWKLPHKSPFLWLPRATNTLFCLTVAWLKRANVGLIPGRLEFSMLTWWFHSRKNSSWQL